jgi:endonuclease YncB( thermonuclease family)
MILMGRSLQIAIIAMSTILASNLRAAEPKPSPKLQPQSRPAARRPGPSNRLRRTPRPNPGERGTTHEGANDGERELGNNGHGNGQLLHDLYHINPKGAQKTAPQLKTLYLQGSSNVQRHIHDSTHWSHWHHLHHAWVWGAYAYLPQPNVVVGVPSGNSLDVKNGAGIVQRVRLAGVGAPQPSQPLFSESQTSLAGLANGRNVRVVHVGVDSDGAIAAQVFLDSGEYLNEKQISNGFAWNAVDDGIDVTLSTAEQKAQDGGLGLWGQDYLPAIN